MPLKYVPSMDTLTKDFLITKLAKIYGESKIQNLIYLYNNICCNYESIPSNLGGRNNKLLSFTLTQEQYKDNTSNKYEINKTVNPTIDFDYLMTKNKIIRMEIKYDQKKYI